MMEKQRKEMDGMRLLRDNTFNEIINKTFEAGLETGYRLAFQIAKLLL